MRFSFPGGPCRCDGRRGATAAPHPRWRRRWAARPRSARAGGTGAATLWRHANSHQPLSQTAHHSCCDPTHIGRKNITQDQFLALLGVVGWLGKLTYNRWPEDPAEFKQVRGLLAPLAPPRVAQGPKYQQKGIREAQPQAQEDQVTGKP